MPIMEVKVLPLGTKTPSVSEKLIPVFKLLDKIPDVKYQLTAMGTIIEGKSLLQLYRIAAKIHEKVLSVVDRVVVFTEVDERKDKHLSIKGKVLSVQKKRKSK